MLRRLASLTAVLALLAAGCGSDEPREAATPPAVTGAVQAGGEEREQETKATAGMEHDPEPAAALQQFVEAAAAGDTDALWELLSVQSRERLGPKPEFVEQYAPAFRKGVGTFAGTDAEVVVTGSDESGWGVAAIAGVREREGRVEFAAYGAALRLLDGEWRLELGSRIDLTRIEGNPAGTLEVEVSADAEVVAAGLWVDGQPLWAVLEPGSAERFVVHAERLELADDSHVGVVFARTDTAAAAGAFPLNPEPATTTTTT